MSKKSFDTFLKEIQSNDPNITRIYASEVEGVEKGENKYETFTNKQIKQLALAIRTNTQLLYLEINYYFRFIAPEELLPYLKLIEDCIARNIRVKEIEDTKFKNYLKSNFTTFMMKPLVIVADLTKEVFSYTLGLMPLASFD